MSNLPKSAGTVIVGAGVMGCSIAFHLAAAGVRNVVVVERDRICAGNTRKSGALVRMHYDNEPDARLAFFSLRYFRHWADIVGYGSGFTNTGAAVVVGRDNVERLRKNVAMLRSLGINTHEITLDELKKRQPFIVTDDLGGVAFEPDSGYADPLRTTQSFATRAVELGATICEGVRVEALRIDGDRMRGLRTNSGDIDTESVVLAAGPWTVGLLRPAGVELGVHPVRAEIAFVRRPPELSAGHFVYLDHQSGSYFRPTGDGLSLLGTGTARRPLAEDQMDSYDESSTERIVEVIRTRIRERAPALADAPLARGHAGLYDMSPDEKAILDRVPGVEGAYLAVGFSGTGFKQSPAVGVAMSELVTKSKSSTLDISAFAFDRFASGRLLRGEHEYVSEWPMH